jgi:hypothetical protein
MEYTREVLDQNGKYLDKKSYKDIFPSLKEDSFYDLFYYKQNDVFITISENKDSVGQEITDDFLDRQYRETYLNIVLPPNDFLGLGEDAGSTYESDERNITLELVLETGRKLEERDNIGSKMSVHLGEKDLRTIYYLEEFDVFVSICTKFDLKTDIPKYGIDCVDRDGRELRKKYNIPFQDERFKDL